MKKIIDILKRDKVDLIMFVLVIVATVQHFFTDIDLTIGYAVMALYVLGVMYRLYNYNMEIRKNDKDILKLNLHIQEQNKLLGEIIKKQPTGNRHTFKQKLEELKRKKNLTNSD